jgi:hypothetical protein
VRSALLRGLFLGIEIDTGEMTLTNHGETMTMTSALILTALLGASAGAQALPAAGGRLDAAGAALSEAVQGGDLDAAGKLLDGLFTGTAGAAPGGQAAAGPRWVWHQAPLPRPAWDNPLPLTPPTLTPSLPDPKPAPTPTVPPTPVQPRAVSAGSAVGSQAGKAVKEIVKEAVKTIEEYVGRDRTNESKEKNGGCRMKGTC